ncbi:MAG: glucose 1-dehydrogenase [Chloroflexota bacterium]
MAAAESILKKFNLSGKVALVTGGSRGIGRAIAGGLAEAGADVVLVSRKLPDLEAAAKEIAALGRKAVPLAANVRNLPEIEGVVKSAADQFGHIDILVNNAGTSPALAAAIDAEEGLWDVTIGLNLKGLFFLSQAVARVMREHGGGSIINITSMDGYRPEPGVGIYAISKAGVIMATKVMAAEWAQYKIRVNAIAPGNVRTRLGDSRFAAIPGYEEEMLKRTPLGRIANPEEMAGAALLLASDASSFITGETISADGGILLT